MSHQYNLASFLHKMGLTAPLVIYYEDGSIQYMTNITMGNGYTMTYYTSTKVP